VTEGRIRVSALAIVAIVLLGYPALVLADGARFPSRDDECVHVAPEGSTEALDLVFGRRDTPTEAAALLEKVQGVGYVDAEMQPDGCGRWKVLYDGIEFYEQGLSSRTEARGAGLTAELEIEPPG
jgi:hypothetical protein